MFALRLYSSLWTDLYPHGKHTIAYKYQRNTAFVNHCILQLQNDILALICSCQLNFFTETAVTPKRKVKKSFPRWEINRHAEG